LSACGRNPRPLLALREMTGPVLVVDVPTEAIGRAWNGCVPDVWVSGVLS